MNQILEWSDKDFKTANMKVLQWSTLNSLETNEKTPSNIMKIINKNQIEIVELKSLQKTNL